MRVTQWAKWAAVALGSCVLALGVQAQTPTPTQAPSKPLKLGVIPVAANAATELAIQEAKAQGLDVELIEFSDWVVPNSAVADGAVDFNFFQHEPFMQQFNRNKGAELMAIDYGYSTTMGIYSKKLKKGEAIPDKAKVAIPSDPVNTARALLLLQTAGLIQLKPGVTTEATLDDIVSNPKQMDIIQIDGAHSARSFDDVTASVTYATFAKQAGIAETDGLLFDNTDPANIRRYAIRFVTTPARAKDARILKFIDIYQNSPQVQQNLKANYGELIDFAWQK